MQCILHYPAIHNYYHVQLVQELYHVQGQKFASIGEVQQKVSSLGERWSNKLVPAICQLANETGKEPPASDAPNGEHIFTFVYIHTCMVL